jgi:hypothetical protein
MLTSVQSGLAMASERANAAGADLFSGLRLRWLGPFHLETERPDALANREAHGIRAAEMATVSLDRID